MPSQVAAYADAVAPVAGDPAWLAAHRAVGLAAFRTKGFPTQALEAWRFTSLRRLAEQGFVPAHAGSAGVGDAALSATPAEGAVGLGSVAIINGVPADGVTRRSWNGGGIRLFTMAEALAQLPARVEAALFAQLPADSDGLAGLNAALMPDLLVAAVPAGARPQEPLLLSATAASAAGPVASYSRMLILVEPGADATIMLDLHATGSGPTFANLACEIVLSEGARLNLVCAGRQRPADIAISRIAATLQRDAALDFLLLDAGAGLSRTELTVSLDAPDARCGVDAGLLVDGRRHGDFTSIILHNAPHTESREVVKTVAAGQGHGVFQGRITVAKDAQKIAGHQLSRALLLSPGAAVNTKPELEIYADDVKCSHGATIGQLDEAQLFYMRARGIDADTARRLLVAAFVAELLERVTNADLRARLDAMVAGFMDRIAGSRLDAGGAP